MKINRLTSQKWSIIKAQINSKESMAHIAREHGISRPALYDYAKRHGWINAKPKSFFSKIKKAFSR